jgi:hypothetical protein
MDMMVKILCPTRSANRELKGYTKPKPGAVRRVPMQVTLFVVDESNYICKLVFAPSAGEAVLESIAQIFEKYEQSDVKRNVVLKLRSVYKDNVNGHAAVSVGSMSLFESMPNDKLHSFVNGKCRALFLNNDPEISRGVAALL